MTHSPETRKKMSTSAKLRWNNRTDDERRTMKERLTIAALAKWIKLKNLTNGDPCCQNCLAWVSDDHESGSCHRHPPSGSEGFPESSFDTFCTECLLPDTSKPIKTRKRCKSESVVAGLPPEDCEDEVVGVVDDEVIG